MSAFASVSLKPSNSAQELIKDGWFSEIEAMWPGQKFCLKVDEVLLNGKSDFQDILVFKSATYGIVLVLDGVIQVTERDEFAYQEMITHLPLFANRNPKKVLIIGGGDGGVLREVAKHSSVETIHMCEIDSKVVEVGKAYYTNTLAVAFNDPRLTLLYDDAARYLREEGRGQNYDCIICDSSDPVGPAETLFQTSFFATMKNALAPGGVVCTQGECQWLHLDLITKVIGECRTIFSKVNYAYTSIPTYPSGQIGFIVCTNDETLDTSVPSRTIPTEMVPNLKFYTSELHRASFVLPAFTASKINL